MALFTIDAGLCNRCGMCIAACPASLVRQGEDGLPTPLEGKEQHCIRCGHCAAVCPAGALTLELLPIETFIKSPRALSAESLALWLKARRSIRQYKDKPVSRELLEKVFDVVRYAPSGHNAQPVAWSVAGDRDAVVAVNALVESWSREQVREKTILSKKLNLAGAVRAVSRGRDVITRGAPVLAVAHAPVDGITPMEDGVIACAWLELAARSLGLGSCFCGYVMLAARESAALRQALGIGDDREVCGAAMLGHPAYKYRLIPPRNPARLTYLSGSSLVPDDGE